jgi:hypothetical protein
MVTLRTLFNSGEGGIFEIKLKVTPGKGKSKSKAIPVTGREGP